MEPIHTMKLDGRACCAIKEEVWMAKQSGGVAVYAARTGAALPEVSLRGLPPALYTHMTAVFDNVWLASQDGDVHVVDATTHALVDSVNVSALEKKAPLVRLAFNGHTVLLATRGNCLYVHHPLTHKRLTVLATSAAPCTAAAQFYSFVVGGDAKGGLYVWDPLSGACVLYHGESCSAVVCLLHEPSTGTIWVARANANVDVYTLEREELKLQRRVESNKICKVTSMVAVSGTVVATTFSKQVVQIDASTAAVMSTSAKTAHSSFIHGCCKAMHQEVAQVWTVGNDGTAHVWQLTGKKVPVIPVPVLPPHQQAMLADTAASSSQLVESELRVEVQAERMRHVDYIEALRNAREVAQELRLRLAKRDEQHLAELESVSDVEQRKELEEQLAKLTKDITDITSSVHTVERERNNLREEVLQLKIEVSNARMEANTMQADRATVAQQLSQEKTSNSTLEQRLRDVEGQLASLQAEHRRVCDQASPAPTANALFSREAQENSTKSHAALEADLEQAQKMNGLMSAAIASMEYTIRRQEQEEKDLTALLNAFRGRVANRVSDPHLSALLLATIVRNAPRFDLDCSDFMKVQLMTRNGPFLQFIQTLRATDPDGYEKLIRYLQHPSLTEKLPTDTQAMLDRLVELAATEGEVSGQDMVSFKKSIPGLIDTAALNAAAAPRSGDAAPTGTATAAPNPFTQLSSSLAALLGIGIGATAPAGATTTAGAAAVPVAASLLPHKADGEVAADAAVPAASAVPDKPDAEMLADGATGGSSVLPREARAQQAIDDNYIREQQAMFEFILKTRRLLAESLAVLHKRTTSARQVVEALLVNSSVIKVLGVTGACKAAQPQQTIFADIIRELAELTSEVVHRYLTSAEKQRLGIAQ